jgi:hypothetical protein
VLKTKKKRKIIFLAASVTGESLLFDRGGDAA